MWPPNTDIDHALQRDAQEISGLYIGDYEPEYLVRSIIRHSVYANKILIVDPFVYPKSVRDDFNPVLNPGQYRSQTLKHVNLWFSLLPWVEAGIVEIIRPPTDFDASLNWQLLRDQEKKFKENTDLQKASRESVAVLEKRHSDRLKRQQLVLGAPDDYLRRQFEEKKHAGDDMTFEAFMKVVNDERERDPNFLGSLDVLGESQLFSIMSGASYPSAKMIANLTGSYLFTDIPVKWREIELDRAAHSAENKIWAPFAKAIQESPLRYLDHIELEHALTLRLEGRLESLRAFLSKVWKTARSADEFGEENARLMAEELSVKVKEAEIEWKQIDTDLLKIVGATGVTGLLAAGPMIAAGHAAFLAAAIAVGGVGSLVNSTRKRKSFPDRFPAAFFMHLQSKED